MKRVLFVVAAVLFILSCNGMPPVDTGQLFCMATCKNGKCEKKDGVWLCIVTTPVTCPAQCPSGQICTDPKLGCVPKPVTCAEIVCPQIGDPTTATVCVNTPSVGAMCVDPVVVSPTTCDPACKANEKCVVRPGVEKVYECVVVLDPVVAPLIPDEELTLVKPPGSSQMWAETDAAIKRYQTIHPEKWMDRSGLQCLSAGPSGIDEAFLAISTELLRQTIVAGQSISQSGQRSDCIFVNRTGGNLYEEMHIFDYSRACAATTSGAYKQLYKRSTGSVPPPDPPPCPALPCPLKTYPDGKAHWKFNSKPHTMGNADSTPVTVAQEPFCAATGQSPMAEGTLKASCPMRKEGDPDRAAVENWLLDGGPVRDSKDGGNCEPNNTTNPYAFLMRGGNCRNCNTGKTVCTDWW